MTAPWTLCFSNWKSMWKIGNFQRIGSGSPHTSGSWAETRNCVDWTLLVKERINKLAKLRNFMFLRMTKIWVNIWVWVLGWIGWLPKTCVSWGTSLPCVVERGGGSVAVAVTLCLLVLLVLVLLSVHVKRLGGFPYAGFSLNRPHWADSVIESRCPNVSMSVCLRHRMHFF